VKIARDYDDCLPLLDLINEGNIGLMKALKSSTPRKVRSSLHIWWIKQNIKRALANQSKTIRLPVHVVDKVATCGGRNENYVNTDRDRPMRNWRKNCK
jgi:RNA polymerase primary sigma factor